MDIDNPRLSIASFSLMRSCGIVYRFMDAKKLEGVYILPEDAEDVSVKFGVDIGFP